MGAFEELSWRGLVQQTTAENMAEVLATPLTMYVGCDPSAPSLHAGNLVPLMLMTHLRRAGHQVIALVGGATGMIGDPSGKSSERKLLANDEVSSNTRKLSGQIERFFASDEGPPVKMVDNLEWLGSLTLLEFLRDIGKHFAVNQMIQRDSVKQRFESREEGISYTEFSYMLLQAYDFLELFRRHGCRLQSGASDQWGNIVSGVDLVRRIEGKTVYGLTTPLLTDAGGKKYGKSEKGAVYLDPELTPAYDFYQFFLNTADADVGRFLRWLTVRPREEIEGFEASLGAERLGQRALAQDLTRRVHGEEALARILRANEALFGGGDLRGVGGDLLDSALAAAPSITVPRDRFEGQGALVVDLLVEVNACPSKSDARRQLGAGGIAVNGVSLGTASVDTRVTAADLIDGRLLVLRRGKRNNYVVRVA
ncbi:MAG TPA: tyrosine--tRNA ligase [Polyangia bacterium]|jgi:tyrosyl-tRNA synthetase|nr:tyrosine--tRNA ligase [Polyangia bacterium]